jgi:diacylglycerol O-acyltransferase / wax synthase
MDRLSPLDALFVDAEDQDPHTSMAIASIAVFDGPPPAHEEFLAFLTGRLPLAELAELAELGPAKPARSSQVL